MKRGLRAPRVFLPRDGFETWAVLGGEYSGNAAAWEKKARIVGEDPSALKLTVPDFEEDVPSAAEAVHEAMFRALEEEWTEKLNRGIILTERETSYGLRRGIVAALDLEHYSFRRGESALARPVEAADEACVMRRLAERRGAVLEFPNVVAFFRDKKCRLMPALAEEDYELLYDFELMEGGRLRGYYIPADEAYDILEAMHVRGDPCFAVFEGCATANAAKRYWEEISADLTEDETPLHPARFLLTEFVNLYDDAIEFSPVHRVVECEEPEAFRSYFSANVRCKRQGNVLLPVHADDPETIARTDKVIAAYLRSNGGAVRYASEERAFSAKAEEEGCVGIRLAGIGKETLLDAIKGGRQLPAHSFVLGGAADRRYCLEGREISYD